MNIFEPFYDAADMSACVPASTTVAQLNALAAQDDIRFPLWRDQDETLESLYLNTRICSRSFRFGSVGDNTLGCRFQLSNGKTLDLGGRVVKNVVGFDLTRFFAASQGRLGRPVNLILRLRPFPEIRRELSLSGNFDDLEAFRMNFMRSAWVHCIDAFDFELDASGLRLGLAYACSAAEAGVFEGTLASLSKKCNLQEAPLPKHPRQVATTRLVPLSQALIQARDFQKLHGGRVSGYLGHGALLLQPESPLPTEVDKTHADLEAEMLRGLDALP